ncbi:GNAT family N-acetyltransferase [Paenibacillus sp. NEAU-GSW1]|uniref:GNAT family N-acetyltransferase n=1 Tax=Paenibacillus sp. NEAU-GSW1 TaxID=2682486 RepID=UPI0012E1BCA0|nr:GNAT family N-acetyltransferase [Paenibacillus sp. NEAU-GSW1]MUT67848.1 GNAT family N-acetyltransferase [Paenibacillus sp. NEAU-GSW1]
MSNLQQKRENIFTIECEDIILREYLVEDLDALHNLTWQPHFHAFLMDWNVAKEQRAEWISNYEIPENKRFLDAVSSNEDIGDLRLRLAIVSKRTGQFIGVCGTGIKDELPSPNREIYFGISSEHRNQGYTTQAARGLIDYLFDHVRVEQLVAIAQITNVPSNRVIQKCGFAFQSEIELDNRIYRYYKLSKN